MELMVNQTVNKYWLIKTHSLDEFGPESRVKTHLTAIKNVLTTWEIKLNHKSELTLII